MTQRNPARAMLAFTVASAGLIVPQLGAVTVAQAVNPPHPVRALNSLNDRTIDTSPARTFRVRNEKELRRAVARANRLPGKDKILVRNRIVFDKGPIKGGPFRGDLDIKDDLVIDGQRRTAGRNLIDANRVSRIFDIAFGERVIIKRLRMNGGLASLAQGGGAIRSRGTLILKSSSITQSEAAKGGAIFHGGRVKVQSSVIQRNAARRGSAIASFGGTTVIRKSRVALNRAYDRGGIYATNEASLKIVKSRLKRNRAGSQGGGVYASTTSSVRVLNSLIQGNVAEGDDVFDGGGGLYSSGMLEISGSTLKGNRAIGATGSGGGVLNADGTLTMSDTVLQSNAATRAGGGVEIAFGANRLTDVDLLGNSAGINPGNGGGLHVSGDGNVTYSGGALSGNDATNEGGGLWNDTGTFTATGLAIGTGDGANTAPTGPTAFNSAEGGSMTVNGVAVAPGTGF